MLIRQALVLGALTLTSALLPFACSDDSGKRPPKPDQGRILADLTPLPPLTCKADQSDCRDFVVSRLLLPTSASVSDSWALRLDGGRTFNELGGILSALSGLGPSTTIQNAVDDVTYQGATIVLARLHARDFTNDESAAGQTWVGAKTACCPNAAGDRQKCKEEALAGCFAGDPPHSFAVDANAGSTASILAGKLSGGNLSLNAPSVRINLPLTVDGVMQLTLKSVQLRARLSAERISDGALAGTIAKSEVQQKLIPNVALMLDVIFRDPATASDLKDFLSTVFDRNKDGHITAQEVADSSIKSLLEGDVDTDGDGEKELSLGIGFEGVRAIIEYK